MRTAIFLFAGLVLLAMCVAVARAFKPTIASAAAIGVPIFIVLWCLVAAINMWIGVNQAGYSMMEELPIFLIVFLPPAVAALLVKWHWR
ncbi:MAG: hypothetical protein ACREPB_01345 [Arenimonas sp.]